MAFFRAYDRRGALVGGAVAPLADAGIDTSVGSVGDSYDDALAESIIGLFKTEVIKFLGPWKSVGQVEWETLQWVSWYNNERLHSAIGHRPPQEVEEAFHEQMNTLEKAAQVLNKKASRKPGAVQCLTARGRGFLRPARGGLRRNRGWWLGCSICSTPGGCRMRRSSPAGSRTPTISISPARRSSSIARRSTRPR
jgi:hypothetical protein